MAKTIIVPKISKVKFLFKRSENRKAELVRLYGRLMYRARGREYISGVHERHHIQPRCLGGTDDSSNIVVLTFGEHFLAHYLLALTTEGEGQRGVLFALKQMTAVSNSHKSRIISRRQHEISRKANVEAVSGPEHGKAISAGHARRKEELGPDAHGKATSAGMARRKEELGPDAHGKAISAGMLKNSPPVRCLNDGQAHENAVVAAKFYGLRNTSHIHSVCRGERKHTGGLRFEYI